MPEASKSNVHGHIHGKALTGSCNTGGVEEKSSGSNTSSTHSGVDKNNQHPTTDVTVDIGLQSPAGAGQALRLEIEKLVQGSDQFEM
jgi:hypothetical protein